MRHNKIRQRLLEAGRHFTEEEQHPVLEKLEQAGVNPGEALREFYAFETPAQTAFRFLKTAYNEMESWTNDYYTGASIAYMTMAILDVEDLEHMFEVTTDRDRKFVNWMRENFPLHDPVWSYVAEPDADSYIINLIH